MKSAPHCNALLEIVEGGGLDWKSESQSQLKLYTLGGCTGWQHMAVFKTHHLYLKCLCFKICLLVFHFLRTNVCSTCWLENLIPPPLADNCILQSMFRLSDERLKKQRTYHSFLVLFDGKFVIQVISFIIKNWFWENACSRLVYSITVKAFVFTAISV